MALFLQVTDRLCMDMSHGVYKRITSLDFSIYYSMNANR